MQVIINNTDITKYINESSYSMDSVDVFKEWEDGNFRKHQIKTRSKVKGSFTMTLGSFRDFEVSDLLELIENATTNDVTTMLVYLTNIGKCEAINCYLKISSKAHKKLSNGTFLDKIQIDVEES